MAPSNGYFLYENHSLELLDLVTLLRVKQHTPKIGLFVAFCSLNLSKHYFAWFRACVKNHVFDHRQRYQIEQPKLC